MGEMADDPPRIVLELQRKLAECTNERDELLKQQAATSEVFKLIGRGGVDRQQMLVALVELAARLCNSDEGTIWLPSDDHFALAASCGLPLPKRRILEGRSLRPGTGDLLSSAVRSGETLHVHSLLADLDCELIADLDPGRTALVVPLQRDTTPAGILILLRNEARPFKKNEIELVQNLADQAFVAIQNLTLFNELQDKTRDLMVSLEHQSATAEVLQVIGSSMADSQPVFERILDSMHRLFDWKDSAIFLAPGDGKLHLAARRGDGNEALDQVYPRPISETSAPIVIEQRKQIYYPDVMNGVNVPESLRLAGQAAGNFSVVVTPMLWNDQRVGLISVSREPNVAFNEKELGMLRTFADQAVIAIQNARLFNEVQQRTRELSVSLDELRATQDRLVQTEKLAWLGQLMAGIAHEIKNPLNFVNNFSQLSAELIDEITDVFKNPAIEEAAGLKDLEETCQILKGNLEKVVQHGKRADSIVKSMLLHSREGSGERRATSINDLVQEGLSLANNGAFPERMKFSIPVEQDLDPDAGTARVYPQDITRALLNLVSNALYAAAKRKTENSEESFAPKLSVSTRSLGSSVEIRIRDNGTGIPSELKAKIFNPFFTTKPSGEGTGLGLSMTHDIVVKQHGGRIEVETKLGEFTEFIVTLPRGNGSSDRYQ